MVMEVVQEDMSEGSMQCTEHPFKNSTPGGICAFCLQEKLGKLVSSSFSVAIFPSASSSSSPSFRSDISTTNTITNPSTLPLHPNPSASTTNYHSRRAKLPFLLTQRKKKKKEAMMAAADGSSIVFKRSKTTTTPRNASLFMEDYDSEDYSPQRKGFWSFLYLHSTSKKSEGSHKVDMSATALGGASMNGGNLIKPRERKREELVVVDENESPDQARKVSRSRSVGCGSRSFSGDFLERISTGFGDCSTLRRVESQREGNKPRIHSMLGNSDAAAAAGGGGQDCMKERVKCGGIFSGFIITSTSSSSSSSSYLVSSTNEDTFTGKKTTATPGRSQHHVRNLAHARSKSWGWAFASPMRAFSKPSSSGKRKSSINNVTPNLAAIPSLLTARG